METGTPELGLRVVILALGLWCIQQGLVGRG
jgi:hypothetical protein